MDIGALSVKILKAMGHPIRLKIVKFFIGQAPLCLWAEREPWVQPAQSFPAFKNIEGSWYYWERKGCVQTHYHVALKSTATLIAAAETMSQEYLGQFK